MNDQEFTVELPLFPDPRVVIKNSTVYPSGEDTILAFDLAGSVEGTAYIRSRIWYDGIRKVVRLEWWDFTLDTRSELLRGAFWLYQRLVDPSIGGLLQKGIAVDMRPTLATLDKELHGVLNTRIDAETVIESQMQPVEIVGQFATKDDVVVVAQAAGKVGVNMASGSMPTGREVRNISVLFITEDDNKDPEEGVLIQFLRSGVVQQERWLFRDVEVEQNQAAGPYMFAIAAGALRDECGPDVLRIYKEPHGSPTGNEWRTAIIVKAFYADGMEREVLHRDFVRMGDDNPFDLHFALCW